MITELTPAQIATFPKYVEKWTKIGLSCEPLDFEKAKDAMTRAYRVAGLEPPKKWIVADSPLSAALIRYSVSASVRDSVSASVRDSVWDSVRDSVWASVSASVRDSVRDSVWDSVWDSVRDSVWDSVSASVSDSVFGSHDSGFLSFYDFFLRECEQKEIEKLIPLMDLADSCGWAIPMRDSCILQHRHSELHYDSNNRLHNDSDMAIKYRDGFGVYMWHGTRIPFEKSFIITDPLSITSKMIDEEPNAELRRIMLERIGLEKYLFDSELQPVHTDECGWL